ncbi:hypothetical protein C8A01DRAFT_49376 [Parachaetomium inaequale]|uniref:F-box domain-containing protein n=1 Tax=Parachaetomium inaequale TaxID=2588326 RepID=A0AAN6P9F1_9PEZI|nr:hypothetical protein C8A01DRAFT_49376 [Parachaetomium inaequale]
MTIPIVRYNGRYYIDYHPGTHDWDDDEGHGPDETVDSFPTDEKGYREWLGEMRAEYAARQAYFDRYVFPIPSQRHEFLHPPSPFPRVDRLPSDATYIVNLDSEVFTVDYGAHFKLGNIPRTANVSLLAAVNSADLENPVYSGACDASHIASPALELPEPVHEIGYASRTVDPKIEVGDVRTRLLMRVLAEVNHTFDFVIRQFGREWAAHSFQVRELSFARLWIASGKAKFLSLPEGLCHPRTCMRDTYGVCAHINPERELPDNGYFDREWAGSSAPLLEFGTMFHLPGELPGVSPQESMYWFDGVLISLVLVVDGAAVTEAVGWGLQQGRSNFQLIAMSLFEVILAEVSTSADPNSQKHPFVSASHPLKLAFPSEEEVTEEWAGQSYLFTSNEGRQQAKRSKSQFSPGFGALITFLEVAAQRRCAAKSNGILPPEVYCKILDHVDYGTWVTCSTVSPAFRSYCLRMYRLNDRWTIPFDPDPWFLGCREGLFYYVEPKDTHTGLSHATVEKDYFWMCHPLPELNWMPIIGAEPRALMVNVLLDDGEVADSDQGDEGNNMNESDGWDESDEGDESDKSEEGDEMDKRGEMDEGARGS